LQELDQPRGLSVQMVTNEIRNHHRPQSVSYPGIEVGAILKHREHYFSMRVVMDKCFFLNSEKKLAQIRLVVFRKDEKIARFNSEKWRH